jgi:hypothetical protein
MQKMISLNISYDCDWKVEEKIEIVYTWCDLAEIRRPHPTMSRTGTFGSNYDYDLVEHSAELLQSQHQVSMSKK